MTGNYLHWTCAIFLIVPCTLKVRYCQGRNAKPFSFSLSLQKKKKKKLPSTPAFQFHEKNTNMRLSTVGVAHERQQKLHCPSYLHNTRDKRTIYTPSALSKTPTKYPPLEGLLLRLNCVQVMNSLILKGWKVKK